MANPTKKDRDEITVARSIFDEIVEFTEYEETILEKRARLGGEARATKLTDARKSEIAKKAAEKRWKRANS